MNRSISRRTFLKTTAGTSAALAFSAASYAKIPGANDRISIGQIGCGDRGVNAHMEGIHPFDKEQNVEITAVCDPWRVRREIASAQAKEWYGRPARQFVSYRDVIALERRRRGDDRLARSSSHQASRGGGRGGQGRLLRETAGDGYGRAQAGVRRGQEGENRCPDRHAAPQPAELHGLPRAVQDRHSRQGGADRAVPQQREAVLVRYLKDVKPEDVDWKEFLGDRTMRPFDPVFYSGWYGYREFSDGPVCGYGSHFLDLVHYITGAKFPTQLCVPRRDVHLEGRANFTCPDHVQALWIYPEGFMVSYSTLSATAAATASKSSATRACWTWSSGRRRS